MRVGVRLKDGEELKYETFAEDDGCGVDNGKLKVDEDLFTKAADAKSTEELFNILENAVTYSVLDWETDREIGKKFDPKDFELYADVKETTYSKEEYEFAKNGVDDWGNFYEGSDDSDDGRSVPYSKSIVIFDKAIREKVKDLDDVKDVVVENIHIAGGEYLDNDDFSDLDRDEGGMAAEHTSAKEMDLKTQEIKEETKSRWL